MNNTKLQTGPLQTLYSEIKKILDNTEFKNKALADAGETDQSKALAEIYLNAKIERDTFITYSNWWTLDMFQEIDNSFSESQLKYYKANPYKTPLKFRENLLKRSRQWFFDAYVEMNPYYRMLMGLPDYDDTNYLYMSSEMEAELEAEHLPIHEQSDYIQSLFMNTDEYKQMLTDWPDKKYLKYLGKYKVDLYTARKAYDFEIIRYPSARNDINPNLLAAFAVLYKDAREYVMVVLYNNKLEDIYKGYRNFMGILITASALLQVGNKALEAACSRRYLDDVLLHTTLSLYGIPETLLLTNEVRRKLALALPRLVKEKGTSEVYYDLIDILGYQDVVVSKLMLMKGQQFNKGEALDSYEPYFLQLDLKDKNPYQTVASGKAPIYSYHEIIDPDPMWWDLADVQEILHDSKYTMADSKYIVVDAVIHQMDYLFESIYFARMIIDNKPITSTFKVEIPEILGVETVSVYDCVLFLVCATCMANSLTGSIPTHTDEMLSTAGFNFELDLDAMIEWFYTTEYIDADRIMSYLTNTAIVSEEDVSRLYDSVMQPLREFIETKMTTTTNRVEFLEYEAAYKAIFTYDVTRNKFMDDFELPLETIRKKYGLTEEELEALNRFYPQNADGSSVKVEEFNNWTNSSRYHYPFLALNDEVTWFVHLIVDENGLSDDRGYLYFNDILSSPDLRNLYLPDGRRMFMDYEENEWVVNQKAVDQAIHLIDELDDDELQQAYFQIYTPTQFKTYKEGEKLPAILRTGALYKNILKDKITMDMQGLAVPPTTYFEALKRQNKTLYSVLMDGDRFNKDRTAWTNDAMSIVTSVESGLVVHMKYFEQAVLGQELFFRPLITLIKHFKSVFVDIARTGLRYVFDDKMDAGGNSHMMKIFDEIWYTTHYAPLGDSMYDSPFGIYDTIHRENYGIDIEDKSQMIKFVTGEGFIVEEREAEFGSMRMVDECKLFKNGTPLDPTGREAYWSTGEPGLGRWEDDFNFLMQARKETQNVQITPMDFDAWKNFVEK